MQFEGSGLCAFPVLATLVYIGMTFVCMVLFFHFFSIVLVLRGVVLSIFKDSKKNETNSMFFRKILFVPLFFNRR